MWPRPPPELKVQFRGELDFALVHRGSGYPPELRCPERRAGLREDRAIENVEEFCPKLNAPLFGDSKILVGREVPIFDPGPDDDVTSGAPEAERAIHQIGGPVLLERSGIEELAYLLTARLLWERPLGFPISLGRFCPPEVFAPLNVCVTVNGLPLWKLVIPLICHPPKRTFAAPP